MFQYIYGADILIYLGIGYILQTIKVKAKPVIDVSDDNGERTTKIA